MKKIIVSLFLLLFCGVGSNFAQLVRNVEFEVQYDSISQRLGAVYMIKDYKQVERECKQLIELFNSSSEEIKSYYTWLMKDCYYNLACCQSMQNKKNVAIQSLELAYEHNYQNYRQFVQDTDLDNLRNERRYKTIHDKLKEVGDFQYILQNASGYEPNLRTDTLRRFAYANPKDSSLVRVREYFQLDSVAGSGDERSEIKNILTYIHNIIKHDGNHENPKTVNAIGLAEACKDGSRGLNCRGLATVLNECYLAMGFKSRFITCMPQVYINDCHVINVIYSNTLYKWIWVDPTQHAWVRDENGLLLSV